MEALSPRDTNAQIRVKKQQALKPKQPAAPPAPKLSKEKDHPPPPPAEVREPPSSDRKDGAVYHTGRLLGKGGFAICYEGQLAGTKQLYALKMVKSRMPQKKMEQKFQTELQIHSKMRHPNIVQFHRAFAYQECTYIVLELCPNGSLMDMVKRRRFITEPEVRYYTVQMAGAIKYMHGKGIIHRDLKMGNIFLDKDMNIKVGDFGLAALLMSDKDMVACRRTTLCGTPNYIAPEILEKGKGGHDHAVDIWSLGIIIYALLTGKPPFQSNTADEIYRRAREREYDWPESSVSGNYISEETKDLVAELLQSPDQRPNPDTIVQHPFFSCGWMPQSEEITPDLRDYSSQAEKFLSMGPRAGKSSASLRNLKKLCVQCEVGPWNQSQKRHTSTYREVAAEEKAGLTPAVPLPEDVVYRPFDEWLREQADQVLHNGGNSKTASDALNKVFEPVPASRLNEQVFSASTRTNKNFAAQQRARNLPSSGDIPSQAPRLQVDAELKRSRRAPIDNQVSSRVPSMSQSLRSQPIPFRVSSRQLNVEERLAADVAEQLNIASTDRKSQNKAFDISPKRPPSLFNPGERLEAMPGTQPDHILARLRRLQAELERALNSRSMARETNPPSWNPTIVVKWVDYTNKFGLGYILSNGSVGCIFKRTLANGPDSNDYLPPSGIVVRDAEWHLQNRGNTQYKDRHQLVPISGRSIEFYENRAEEGICRAKVNPQNFKISVSKDGEAGKLSRGVDEWDDRKREKVVLWKKFANYMTAFGRDQDYSMDEAQMRASAQQKGAASDAGNVITFYQRFGDVGCWAFCDGHFQFNFPDHTKIVLSADGTWCDFYHLPLEAARDLALKGTISSNALDERQQLSYPLQTLLNFITKPARSARSSTRTYPQIDPMLQGIPQANEFREKIEFIRLIIKEWVENGGMGNSDMEPKGRLRWAGNREIVNVKAPYKHVWVTVGARGGDDRRVAWFDPKRPEAIVPDIE
ncbi:hypothetical protein F5884DRAFT_771577 [Xylogone sp. PMI_703]|nr:hypothetical protein F5884DRAFT_771577 [Xylogone sp. PMI_703]